VKARSKARKDARKFLNDDKAPFLAITTTGSAKFRRAVFVRATSMQDAHAQVIAEASEHNLFQVPDVQIELHVVSAAQISEALRLKEVARAYWRTAAARAGKDPDTGESAFEQLWDERGAEPWAT